MPDTRFFRNSGALSLPKILDLTQTRLPDHDPVDQHQTFSDVSTLQSAEATDVSFLHNKKYLQDFKKSKAGLVFCLPEFIEEAPSTMLVVATSTPYRAYAQVASTFYPTVEQDHFPEGQEAISPTALLGKNVILGPGVIIGDRVEIGEGTRIGAYTVIGPGVQIGQKCLIGSHVTVSHAIIGNEVVLYPGVRIGQAGFGFFMDAQGHVNVPQLGRVILEDCVEIGSNTTIDRGTLEDTFIGKGTHIDNLVQIGHGVQTGRNCVIVAQVGISGSTRLGNFVIAAGQVGFSGHLEIGDGVRIAAQSGVIRDISAGETVGGYPAVPVKQWHRQTVAIGKLANDRKKGGG